MTTDRAAYTSGLRKLADLLDEHEELPLPYDGTVIEMLWIQTVPEYDEQRRLAQTFARLIPGTVAKSPRGDALDLIGAIDGLNVQMIVDRDAVCERVVTGTREVTEDVPDPAALAAVPTTTVTRTVEDVEWVCRPLLTEAASA
ncbi:MAG: hypothetical protein JWM93_2438 [Frankiales bacterium]|nr:hypothetical protein [Frankiales bacterium]